MTVIQQKTLPKEIERVSVFIEVVNPGLESGKHGFSI